MSDITLVKTENKITDVLVNGKPVKKMYMRGLRKAQETRYWLEIDYDTIAQNPFTGVKVVLNPFESTIYNWCLNWYRRYSMGEMDVSIQTYDDMKYFLLALNTQAYYDLLD